MIERRRAFLKRRGFLFEPLSVTEAGMPLASLRLAEDAELIVFSRGSERRGLLAHEMAYHHVAQGELAGEPYLISF